MEFFLELIIELIGELLLQVVVQSLFGLGLRSMAATVKRPWHPVLASIGFNLWGAIAGGISLIVLPRFMIDNENYRIALVFTVPVALGFIMVQIGKYWKRKGRREVAIDHFWNSFAFAFAMSLVRYIFAK